MSEKIKIPNIFELVLKGKLALLILLTACSAQPPVPNTNPDNTSPTTNAESPVDADAEEIIQAYPTSQPTQSEVSQIPEYDSKLPEAGLFTLLTRVPPNEFVYAVNASKLTQTQIETLGLTFTANDLSASGFSSVNDWMKFRKAEAVVNRLSIGVAACSDSRVKLASYFPFVDGSGNVPFVELQIVNSVGSQPTIFAEGTEFSVFTTHVGVCGSPDGCGFAGAIKKILETNPNYFDGKLSQATINEVKRMMAMGNMGDPGDWAKLGAQIQADLNFRMYNIEHFTAFGEIGHADDSFTLLGIVDHKGNIYNINDPRFKLLAEFSEYYNKPHAAVETLLAGQSPTVNIVNLSRTFPTTKLVGALAEQPEMVFKTGVNLTKDVPVTFSEAAHAFGGTDYSTWHLPQKGGGVVIVAADTMGDIATARAAMFAEGSGFPQFIENGGVVFETLIDQQTGRFKGPFVLRTAETLQQDLQLFRRSAQITEQAQLSIGINPLFAAETREIAAASRISGLISEKQFVRLTSLLNAARPFASLLLKALNGASTAVSLYQIGEIVQVYHLGETFTYTHTATQDRVTNMLSDQEVNEIIEKLIQKGLRIEHSINDREIAELTSGNLQSFSISQTSLRDAYEGVFRGWMKYGKGGTSVEAEPWTNLEPGDIGKLLLIRIRPANAINATTLQLNTSLVIRPDFVGENGTYYEQYNSESPEQTMRLDDEATQTMILGNVPIEPQLVVMAIDGNPNLVIKFYVEAVFDENNPENNRFVFRFAGIESAP